jgi:hypothetical protein
MSDSSLWIGGSVSPFFAPWGLHSVRRRESGKVPKKEKPEFRGGNSGEEGGL